MKLSGKYGNPLSSSSLPFLPRRYDRVYGLSGLRRLLSSCILRGSILIAYFHGALSAALHYEVFPSEVTSHGLPPPKGPNLHRRWWHPGEERSAADGAQQSAGLL